MKRPRSLPFQNFTAENWQNVALAAVLTFYALQVGFDLLAHNFCGNLAIDYCAYWSAGRIINRVGYSEIYNMKLLDQFEKTIYPQAKSPDTPYQLVPIPYLPIFVAPFQFLSFLNLESGFLVWTFLNLVGFVIYLRFFTKQTTGRPLPIRLGLMLLLSLPVFLDLFWGQVNIWLALCAGEFTRMMLSNKPFRAGLWLAGWLLKPQLLVLIVPVLLLQRSIKVLAGFSVSTFAVLCISLILAKTNGLISFLRLLSGSAQGGAASNPEIMMNWRMLALHLAYLASPTVGWTAAIIGSILTLGAVWIISTKGLQEDPALYSIALIGIFAATGAVTWHAHLSMSIVLIPPMIYLVMHQRFPNKLLSLWVFMPTAVMFCIYVLAALVHAKFLPPTVNEWLNLLSGLRGLILNLVILAWSVIAHNASRPDPTYEPRYV